MDVSTGYPALFRGYIQRSAQAALAKAGMQVNEVTPAETARMRAKVKPVWDEFSKEVGMDLYREVNAEVDRIRKQ